MVKEKRACSHRFAGERAQVLLHGEVAAHAGGEIALEIQHPVLLVRPARRRLFRTIDVEGFGEPRIAERHHRLGKARADLAHAFHLALRREHLDLGRKRRLSAQEKQRSEAAPGMPASR